MNMEEGEPWWNQHVHRDKLGREIQADELEVLLRNPEYKIVKQEQMGAEFISTVWLGVPHGLAALHYFQTTTFDANREEQECVRYSNLTEAEEGHETVVEKIRSSTELPTGLDQQD